MIAETEFKCYSESDNGDHFNLIGRCLIFEGTELSEYQYLFETLILGKDLGKNPYQFNVNKYSGVTEGPLVEGNLPTDRNLISENLYILTDLELEKDHQIFIGLHYIGKTGEYYLLRVPYGTQGVSSEFINITFRNESGKILRMKDDSYILIMRNNQSSEIEFGSETITTRSYLIANNPKELSELSYLANGSEFPLKAPLYYQKQINSDIVDNIGFKQASLLRTMTNKGSRVLSNHRESWNDLNKRYLKGDIVLVNGIAVRCIVDSTYNTNFNDTKIWEFVYDTNRRN